MRATTNEARQFIEAIASNMVETKRPLASILHALEDGEALLFLGATDADQEMVEEAHDMVRSWISAGYSTLDQIGNAMIITSATAEDEIETAIPFLDMRQHALTEREAGNVLELREFGDVVVLYSPAHHYAFVNEHSTGVGNSLVIDAGDALSAEQAALRWSELEPDGEYVNSPQPGMR